QPALVLGDVDEPLAVDVALVEAGAVRVGAVDLHAVVVIRTADDLSRPRGRREERGGQEQGRDRDHRCGSHVASDDIRSEAPGGAPSYTATTFPEITRQNRGSLR